jgi:hypothetical protein
MKSKQSEMVEVVGRDGIKITVDRSKVCYKLREQKVDGETILCAVDAFYKRDETGALRRLYNSKPGKAAKKALKREKIKQRNAIAAI